MQLSEHFSFEEMTVTGTGLPNVPNDAQKAELLRLCETVLEPYRALVGPIKVNSGFRSPQVNSSLRGHAAHSQHMDGQAADTVPLHVGLEEAFQAVKASAIPYDQLIIEPSWIHISCHRQGAEPRRQCLRAHWEGGRMVYEAA